MKAGVKVTTIIYSAMHEQPHQGQLCGAEQAHQQELQHPSMQALTLDGAPSDGSTAAGSHGSASAALITGATSSATAPGGSTRHMATEVLHALPASGPCDMNGSSITAAVPPCMHHPHMSQQQHLHGRGMRILCNPRPGDTPLSIQPLNLPSLTTS